MRYTALLLLLASSCAFAFPPGKNAVASCLTGDSYGDANFDGIPSNDVSVDDSRKNGYTFSYLIRSVSDGFNIGLVESKSGAGLIFGSSIYRLNNATLLVKAIGIPYKFDPNLADWGNIKGPKGSYLCVRFNFDGIGQSGSFQNIVGAYLLSKSIPRKLYYIVDDVRKYER